MEIKVLTHQGIVIHTPTEAIQVVSQDRNFGILENHIPVVTVIDNGYIKYTVDKKDYFVVLSGAIFEYSNNHANVLSQEAQIGETLDIAKELLKQQREIILENNKKDTFDFTKKEKELKDHIKNSGAGVL